MGLEALHIAYQGEHPIFLYGQNYMGIVEAYLGSVLFRLIGTSVFSLRLGMIILYALFLVSMYLLTRLLYTQNFALITVALLGLGNRLLLTSELLAVGGVVETLLFGSLLMLLSLWLALTSRQELYMQKKRFIVYACWGATVGIGLWSHLLICPFVLVASLLIILFCRHELRTRVIISTLLGFILGALPLIIYNLTAPLEQNSFAVFWQLHRADQVPVTPLLFLKEMLGTVLFSIPSATGIPEVCRHLDFPLFGPLGPRMLQCTIMYGIWSLGYIVLFTIGGFLAARTLWRMRYHISSSSFSAEERKRVILHTARLLLLLSAVLTIVSFALSPIAAIKPYNTRYLIGLLIVTPAVIWPLWSDGSSRQCSTKIANFTTIFKRGLILLVSSLLLLATIPIFGMIPDARMLNQQQDALVQDLVSIGATHIYSEYWTCDSLIFASRERVICGVVDTQLHPGLNRYFPYYSIVSTDPRAAYVFPLDSDFATTFSQKIGLSKQRYKQFIFDGYIVYLPQT